MIGAYIDKQFAFQVACIRGAELSLLNQGAINELIQKKYAKDVFSALREKGYGKETDKTSDELLSSEENKLWKFIDELVPERSYFDVFRLPNDYHNLKAAIKESTMEYPYPGIYLEDTVVPAETVKTAVSEHKFDLLPSEMQEIAKDGLDMYLRTRDGQLLDVFVDRACLEQILKSGKKEEGFLKEYAELKVASSDIKIAFRGAKASKDREFFETAICDCDTLDKNSLINAALTGTSEAICQYLQTTDYRDATEELRKSPEAFENYCDNVIIQRMKLELRESFGIGPIAAYILAKQYEISSLRMIFAAKSNGFPDDMIKERLRETYV